MIQDSRKALLFGVGLLVGVAAGAVGMLSLRGGDGPYASVPAASGKGAGTSSTAFLAAVAGNCELSPLLPSAGDGDGKERLQDKADAASPDEVAGLILSGKEAAASGRQRDAEVAFLNACRNAAALPERGVVPLADSMYQLARHYANAAAFGAPKSRELFQRSERLYSASLEGFRAGYGEEHEKTRFAREGLVTVQHATGGKAPAAIAKAAPEPVAPAPVAEAAVAIPAVTASAPAAPLAKAPAEARKEDKPAASAPATPTATPAEPRTASMGSNRSPRAERDEERAAAPAAAEPAEPQRSARSERRASGTDEAASSTGDEATRARAATRRSAPREDAGNEGADVALDTPPPASPPVRRYRPAPVETVEPAAADPAPSSAPATASGSIGDAPTTDAGSSLQ